MKYTLAVLFATVVALSPQPLVAIPVELDGNIIIPFVYSKNVISGTQRIFNGQVAKPGQFPWQVALWTDQMAFCSGALICDSWVLTSSDCLWQEYVGKIQKVYLGAYNISQEDEPGRVVTGSVQQIVHEKFDPYSKRNNIGLVQLKDKVTFTDRIKPIPLGADYIPENVNLTLSGWGWDGVAPHHQLSSVILYTDETSMSNQECKHAYGRYEDIIFNTTLCCNDVPHHGPASGDAGNPLIHIGQDGKAVHVALAIFCRPGVGCGQGYPSGYSRTASYVDWIIEKINGTCTLP